MTNPPTRQAAESSCEPGQLPTPETFASVLEHISDGFFAIDGDWRLRYINKAARELVKDKVWVGCHFWEAYSHLVGTPVEDAYRRAATERVPIEFEYFNKSW